LYEAARQELGMKKFLTDGGFGAFTTTFEDLMVCTSCRASPASA
jgi:L-arabinose isomerase